MSLAYQVIDDANRISYLQIYGRSTQYGHEETKSNLGTKICAIEQSFWKLKSKQLLRFASISAYLLLNEIVLSMPQAPILGT